MDLDSWGDFWGIDGKSGDNPVAPVDPADLRSVLTAVRGLNPQTAIGMNLFVRLCSPGADVRAVWYRAAMLQLLSGQTDLLSPWVHEGELHDAVLKVGAVFPIKKLQVGVAHQGFPLDVEEFVRQVREEAER